MVSPSGLFLRSSTTHGGIDNIGRRPLLLTGIALNALLLLSVGVAGCFSSMTALYYVGYVMNFAQLFYAPTVGAVSWTISAEASSIKLRAQTQSLAIMTNALVSWTMNFIAPYLINTDNGKSYGPRTMKMHELISLSPQLTWVASLHLCGWPFPS